LSEPSLGTRSRDAFAQTPELVGCKLGRRDAWSPLPKSLPAEQVQRLVESCDRGRSVGQRNYAVLPLLARLGLRASEIVALRLEDLDWQAAELTVRGKGRQLTSPWRRRAVRRRPPADRVLNQSRERNFFTQAAGGGELGGGLDDVGHDHGDDQVSLPRVLRVGM
jgi:integrase